MREAGHPEGSLAAEGGPRHEELYDLSRPLMPIQQIPGQSDL